MSNNTGSHSSASWVEQALASLLSAPHISLPHAPGGIHTGPGPIDLFSTRFNNTFTPDAKGAVDGTRLDRDGLKEKLLALQRHYNPDTVKFHIQERVSNSEANYSDKVHISFAWTSKGNSAEHEVSTGAVVVTENGQEQISFLDLKGNPALF